MSDFWWRFYKSLPIFNWGVEFQLLLSFLMFFGPFTLALVVVTWYFIPSSLTRNLLFLSEAIAFGGALYFSKVFSRNIGELVVGRLVPVVTAAAEGDLTQTIVVESHDAVGRLGESFNAMTESLSGLVSQVQRAVLTVSSTSEEMASLSEEVNTTTEEVSSNVQQIASGAQSQVDQVGAASQEMKAMVDMAQGISASALSAAELAEGANKIAEEGGSAAKEAIEKMKGTNEVVKQSAVAVRELGDKSKQIGEIVGLITNIADQTNLLALNAAIEAARAGEHGRGFAVVAEEVKKLADGSAEAAKEIAGLIEEIQVDTGDAVSSMDRGVEEVAGSTEVVNKALGALESILQAVGELTGKVEEISAASQEQSVACEKVVAAIDEIAAVSEEAASGTEETAAATEEQATSMEQLTATAQELAGLSNRLQESIGRFSIRETVRVEVEPEPVKVKEMGEPEALKPVESEEGSKSKVEVAGVGKRTKAKS